MYNHRAAAQNQQSAAPSQRRTALNQKEAEEKTEGTDAGPAFAKPEQTFAADLFVTTVHLLDDYEFDGTVLAARR